MIRTYSGWTFGHTITDDNKYLQFQEMSGIKTATLNVGAYSLGSFVNEIARAMNAASLDETYTTSLDRTTRKITITGTNNFDLLITSGTLASQSVFSLAGFNGADLTGAASYEGDSPSGSFFEPQFLLQEFADFDIEQRANNVSINESPTGIIEVIKYGDLNFMNCNIKYQKNQAVDEPRSKGNILRYSQTGFTDLLNFMRYAATKAPLEFFPDAETTDFTECILESAVGAKDGTGFRLKELYTEGFADWYETGKIVFRKNIN